MELIGACDECMFWQREKPEWNGEYGYCQRFPPVIFGKESCQPRTWRKTICGEFVERDDHNKYKGE